jgi:hypothetical protein
MTNNPPLWGINGGTPCYLNGGGATLYTAVRG